MSTLRRLRDRYDIQTKSLVAEQHKRMIVIVAPSVLHLRLALGSDELLATFTLRQNLAEAPTANMEEQAVT